MRVLVTGARTYFSLPIIRELGRRGHDVTAADWDRHCLGGFSRYARHAWTLPRVSDDPSGFVRELADRLQKAPHDVLLPLFEEALAIARHRDLLPRGLRVPLPSFETMLRVHDKRSLCALAAEAGVPMPPTRHSFEPWKTATRFPCVLKVPQSNSARGVQVVHSANDLQKAWKHLSRINRVPVDVPAILQNYIDGYQICTMSFAWEGRPKGTLVYRNVCEFPSVGGAGIARESVRHPVIEAYVDQLLRASRWHGVIGFDFMVDRKSGEAFLIDGNPRFTPATLLAMRSGLDLAGWAVSEVEPNAVIPNHTVLRTRFDPLVALYCLRALFPQARFLERLKRAASFLPPKRSSRSDLFDAGDPGPILGLAYFAADSLLPLLKRGNSALDLIEGSTFSDYESAASVRTR